MHILNTIFKKFGGVTLILAGMLVVAGMASAWTGAPSGTPPANNVSAPINISANDQVKEGGLTVGRTSPTTNGLTIGHGGTSVVIVNGGVSANQFCLGTSCISSWPSGGTGNIIKRGTVSRSCSSLPENGTIPVAFTGSPAFTQAPTVTITPKFGRYTPDEDTTWFVTGVTTSGFNIRWHGPQRDEECDGDNGVMWIAVQ